MKKLSVIIVNYNVCYFLEQALQSVLKASSSVDTEIIVVDNNSADGSVEMVKSKFPSVRLIENKVNTGFSKANNQGIEISTGEYILLLNPDTLVEEDTLQKCCAFMDLHPEAGALGVKMIDGKGNFLPESKRSLPTPEVAFYKIFGLAALFPKSKRFGKYHLTFLNNDEEHEVEVLSGAFMFMRKKALDKSGLLDEDYFMYGEDIDLSYRIIKAGYKNYYFPGTRIIHYKGESTKKTSLNYVFVFYKAMEIFANKHFSSKQAGLFSFLIRFAIYLRATLAVVKRFIQSITLPLTDALFIYGGMFLLKEYWEKNHKYVKTEYPEVYMQIVVPAYIVIWLISLFYSGGYNRSKPSYIVSGLFFGTLLISAISNFLDEWRFSKALIILGGVWACLIVIVIRLVIHFYKYKNFNLGETRNKKLAIVGSAEESQRVIQLLRGTNPSLHVIGFITPDYKIADHELFLGSVSRLTELTELYKIEELIFCSKDFSSTSIIGFMTQLLTASIDFKIVPDSSNYVIGSNSKDTQGELYTLQIKMAISEIENRRNKRLLDIALSGLFILLFPGMMFFVKRPVNFFRNIFKVFSGKYSWVGLSTGHDKNIPAVKKGIVTPVTHLKGKNLDSQTVSRINLIYAREYHVTDDLNIILRSLRNLGV